MTLRTVGAALPEGYSVNAILTPNGTRYRIHGRGVWSVLHETLPRAVDAAWDHYYSLWDMPRLRETSRGLVDVFTGMEVDKHYVEAASTYGDAFRMRAGHVRRTADHSELERLTDLLLRLAETLEAVADNLDTSEALREERRLIEEGRRRWRNAEPAPKEGS